jgi:hypothetical protein
MYPKQHASDHLLESLQNLLPLRKVPEQQL